MSEEKEIDISIVNADNQEKDYLKLEGKFINGLQQINVPFMKLNEKAVIPSYATFGDAGLDLTATSMQWNDIMQCWIYGIGLACAIPYGYVGLLFPRSSVRKYGLIMANSIGVIDAGYRGEISATFKELGNNNTYKIGDKVAQLIIMPFPSIAPIEVDSLPESERGTNGHGSTGK